MFPHMVTIYRYIVQGDIEKYTRQVIAGVYVQHQEGIARSGHGRSNQCSITITTNKPLVDAFGKEWDVKVNDRIVEGVGADIQSAKDLPQSYVVTSVTFNTCGSYTDNIVIQGV